MTRVIVHSETGPRKIDKEDIDAEEGDIAICQCGLSEEYPFCDGPHRVTKDERDDVLYRYETGGDQRYEIEIIDIAEERLDSVEETKE